MFKDQLTRKILAAVILIVFAFSITPAIIFHNWLADHADTVKKPSDTNREQVGKKLFHCQCNNFVAESPFTEPAVLFTSPAVKLISSVKIDYKLLLISFPDYFYLLRGPPAV